MTEKVKEELFAVNTPATLLVENIRGAVIVHAEDRDTIQVKATKYTDTGEDENTLLVFEKVNDSTVHVATRIPNKGSSFFKGKQIRPCKVRYEIVTPEDCSLTLECVSSSAEVRGLRGDHKFELVSGDLTCQRLQGNIKINTVSGDIQTRDLSGGIDITTVSGDLRLAEAEPENLHLHTVSGDMHIEMDDLQEGTAIETVSGDVALDLPPEAAFTIKMTTFTGDLHSDLPAERSHNRIGHRVYQIQGGGPTVRIQSLSGDLHIRNRSEIYPSEATDPHPAVDSMSILDQVANGELSVDGALDALKK